MNINITTAIDYRLFHYSVYEGGIPFTWNNSLNDRIER